jgi:all-trans-retinol dehydrogenase (NAD+)
VFCKTRGWLPKKSLRREHVYITGAGSGLGRLMAIKLSKMGCKVTITDVNEQGLIETGKNKFKI